MAGDTSLAKQARSTLGLVSFFLGDFGKAADAYQEINKSDVVSARIRTLNHGTLACVRGAQGYVEEARTRRDEFLEWIELEDDASSLPVALVMSSVLELFVGGYQMAIQLAKRVRNGPETEPLYSYLSELFEAWGHLRLGILDEAANGFSTCHKSCSAFASHPIGYDWLLAAEAELEFARGCIAAATDKSEEAIRTAEKSGAAFGRGLAERVLGLCRAGDGENDAAVDLLNQSIATLRSCDARIEMARSVLLQSELLGIVGEKDDLELAAKFFEKCQLSDETERCKVLLRS